MRIGSYAAFLLLVAQGKYAFNDDGRALKKVGSDGKPASRATDPKAKRQLQAFMDRIQGLGFDTIEEYKASWTK